MKKFNWYILSSYKKELMGISAILIILFHSLTFEHLELLEFPFGILSIGVEIFLCLSGIGLYFSFAKYKEINCKIVNQYYFKRFLSLAIPYFLIILPALFSLRIINGAFSLPIDAVVSLLKDFSGFKRWYYTNGERPHWYVMFIFFLYIIYPLLYKIYSNLDYKRLVLLTTFLCVLSIGICYLVFRFYFEIYNEIEIAITRFPSFFIGCLLGRFVYDKKEICMKAIIVYAFLSVAIFCLYSFSFLSKYNFLMRFHKTFLFLPIILLISACFELFNKLCPLILKFFRFIGNMSLELYLTHNVLKLCFYSLGLVKSYYYVLLAIASIPISFCISKIKNYSVKRLLSNE